MAKERIKQKRKKSKHKVQGKGAQTTLVFGLTLCYTGLRAEVNNPHAQVMYRIQFKE